MRKIQISLLYTSILCSSILCSSIMAEEAVATDAVEEPNWKGSVEFGYVSSTGNTETTNLNGKFHLEAEYNDWVQKLDLGAFSTSDNDETTAKRFKIEYQGDKKLTDISYLFVNSSYEEDQFSGFQYRSTLTAGYGRTMYNENKMTLDAEIGAGIRQSETDENLVTGLSDKENESMARFALKYLWQIEESRSLTSNISIDAGEETTISYFDISFVTMINGDLSLKVSYLARHTSEVPVDKEKLDTVTSISLLYAF
ncbi:MAG: DUF481 domain-containing protein [Gammaproteobacteria bacterium]|nr:DUF481 domain-containing protein [Gammaproteobacteria bacterium]